MFREWFAQYNWQGLSLINFAAMLYLMYAWWQKSEKVGRIAYIVGGIFLINVILWIFGLRW
jgi:hypothetical protein